MKLRIFISGDDPEMRDALDVGERMKETECEVETYDAQEREGKEIAEVYDFYAFPAFVVITDDGSPINSWIGKIPAEFELKAALNS